MDLHSVRSYSHSPGEDNASIATESLNYIGPSAPPSLNPSDNDTDSDNESVDTDELNASGNKIYDNAKITVQESVVLLYAYIFRHHTTRAATEDLMKVFVLMTICILQVAPILYNHPSNIFYHFGVLGFATLSTEWC